MCAYLVYLGDQIVGLKNSIATYSDMRQSIDNAQGKPQDPVTSPFNGVLSGLGGP